jgi:hypothetical protein
LSLDQLSPYQPTETLQASLPKWTCSWVPFESERRQRATTLTTGDGTISTLAGRIHPFLRSAALRNHIGTRFWSVVVDSRYPTDIDLLSRAVCDGFTRRAILRIGSLIGTLARTRHNAILQNSNRSKRLMPQPTRFREEGIRIHKH